MDTTPYNVYHEFSCKISDFLCSSKKCLFVKAKSIETCYSLIKPVQSEYIFTDLFTNIESQEQLLFLLRNQCNPNIKPAEYSSFISVSYLGFNLLPVFRTISNILRKDILNIEEQIILQLKKLNNSKICILLDCSNNISSTLKSVIYSICENATIETKFILIGNQNNYLNLKELNNAQFSDVIKMALSTETLQPLFPNLSIKQIEFLSSITNDNLKEMCYVYEKIEKDIDLSSCSRQILTQMLEKTITENYEADLIKVLGTASYILDKFSLQEIENILNDDTLKIVLSKDIETIMEEGIENKLIDVNGSEFEFFLSIIKEAFCNLRRTQEKKIHMAISKYLKEYKPFLYELRYHHLIKANSDEADDIVAMMFFNKLHFNNELDERTKSLFAFHFGDKLTCEIININEKLLSHDYNNALKLISLLTDYDKNNTIFSEINYYKAFLTWKVYNKKYIPKQMYEYFNIILNISTEPETKIFTKLLQLSICSNEGDYLNRISPTELYFHIGKLLNGYNCSESRYLLNVLKRKSNSSLSRALAIKHVKSSFVYFTEHKELYIREYFMSGINYVALLLLSKTKSINDVTDEKQLFEYNNPLNLAKSLKAELSLYEDFVLESYLENNYLISKIYCSDKAIDDNELEKFSQLIDKVSMDSRIMFNMNLGTFYAIKENFEKANYYWDVANKINDSHDMYFDYIIQSNKFIADLILGNNISFEFNNIPFIMSDSETMQYIIKRNEILKSLSNSDKKSYYEIKELFSKVFSEEFNNLTLDFWSNPYILSDVQFWSDN